MFSILRFLPLAATLLAAPITFAWSANMMPRQEAVQPDTARRGGMVVDRAPDGLFYVDVVVNGQMVHFLVDTGANVMMLTAADARRVGIDQSDERYGGHVATAGGNTSMGWARLDHVELAGRQMSDVRTGVMHRGLEVSLLGQNMLSRFASVTIAGDTLRME